MNVVRYHRFMYTQVDGARRRAPHLRRQPAPGDPPGHEARVRRGRPLRLGQLRLARRRHLPQGRARDDAVGRSAQSKFRASRHRRDDLHTGRTSARSSRTRATSRTSTAATTATAGSSTTPSASSSSTSTTSTPRGRPSPRRRRRRKRSAPRPTSAPLERHTLTRSLSSNTRDRLLTPLSGGATSSYLSSSRAARPGCQQLQTTGRSRSATPRL